MSLQLLIGDYVILQITLPSDVERKNTKVYEEVVVPPNTKSPPTSERLVPISELDEVQ